MNALTQNQRLVLWILSEQPRTMAEIPSAAKCSISGAKGIIKELKERGLVYVSGHVQKGSMPAPIYATHIKHEKPKQSRVKIGRHPCSKEALIDVLRQVGHMTCNEIVEFSGFSRTMVESTLTTHRDGGRSSSVFRIAAWVWVDRRGWTASFGLGPAADAQKPPTCRRENQRRWEEKHKAKRRLRYLKQPASPFGELVHFATRQAPSNDQGKSAA